MYSRIALCFAVFFCTGYSSANAGSIFDIYKASIPIHSQKPQEEEQLHPVSNTLQEISLPNNKNMFASRDITKEVDERKNSWKLSSNFCSLFTHPSEIHYCQKNLLEQKIEIGERTNIIQRRKMWNLTENYCFERSSFRNYEYCLHQLHQQQAYCPYQKTAGNRIIIDLENQILYGVKNCQLQVYTKITTGKNSTPTPTGEYHVYQKRGPHYMQNEWYVDKALYYFRGYAIHDAKWRIGQYWRPENRRIYGSHGCTNTPTKMMEKIWDEFGVGDTVQVFQSLPEDIAWELKQKAGNRLPFDPEEITGNQF